MSSSSSPIAHAQDVKSETRSDNSTIHFRVVACIVICKKIEKSEVKSSLSRPFTSDGT